MRDILSDLIRWQNEGKSIALATVAQTWGSSPRQAGARMGITLDGKVTGSVSGGCVENAVIEAGIQSLKMNKPQLLHFGVADETAWEVGLACGGSIDIYIQPLDSDFFQSFKTALLHKGPFVHITVIHGADDLSGHEILISEDGIIAGTLGNAWDAEVLTVGIDVLSQGVSQRMMLNETTEIFLDVFLPPPTLVVVGGVHISVALVTLAKTLGYRTVLVDPRRVWGNEERFPNVDELIRAWPDDAFKQINISRSTAIVVLTHDPKLDDPALKVALKSSAFYIGALGSKSTNAKRRERLLNDGLNEAQLSRLHAPIGLDIGAQTPEEIALAIMSEVVNAYRRQNQLSVKNEAQPLSNP